MSVVWRGHDELLGRPVAVKILNVDYYDANFTERVRREAKAVARLSHPHIATVYDYGESALAPKPAGRPADEATPYIVMELVDGESLARVLRRGPLSWPTAVGICAQVAAALAAAHQYGVVHRDISPSNIMISTDGVKVIDFGVAATTGDRNDGVIFGTPAYLAPERLSGGLAQPATDVYGLGIVLYEALTGHLPWVAKSTSAMITAHQYVPPRPVPSIDGLPEQITALCNGCLSVDPAQRPGSGRAYVVLAEAARYGDRRRAALAAHPASRSGPTPSGTRVLTRYAHEPMDASADTVQIDERPAPPAKRRLRRERGGMFILPALLMFVLISCLGLAELHAEGGRLTGPGPSPSTKLPANQSPGAQAPAQAEPKLPEQEVPAPKVLAEAPAETIGCAVSYRTTASWIFGYAALVTIANTSGAAISGWTLQFKLPKGEHLSGGWNGQWTQNGRNVTVEDADYNATLSPGAAVSLGFLGHTRESRKGSADPGQASGFRLNGRSCDAT
jgi:eukaryotic-like serine/threonine-protein kinase